MRKRFFKILSASLISLSLLTACGSNSASGGDVIKIGANLELSGAVATYGQSILEGANLAIEEINNDGGIDGKKIQLVEMDNKSENAEAASVATRLTSEQKVIAIIGAATSGNTLAQIDIANDTKTVIVSPSGTSELITVNEDGSLNEYAFRTAYIDPFQGQVAANFAVSELDISTAAIYIDNASDYSKGLAAAFKETFESLGGKVVLQESYVAKDTDFRSTLTRMNSANPEFIFIPGYYEDVGLIVAQARELGIDVPLMGADGWDSPVLVELAGADALNNTYITKPLLSQDQDPAIQDFVKRFGDKYSGKLPNGFHALGYDTVYLLKDAIERAGSLDPVAIKDALAATKDLALITGVITIDENHNPIKSATILEYVNGEQVFNSKIDPK